MNVERVRELIKQDKRLDGRGLLEYRKIKIDYGVTKTAEGSARVKIGHTEMITGIKMAVEKPYPDTPEDGSLMVGAELLPMSSPRFESGPPSIESIEIARVVDRGIRESKALDTKQLCVEKGEKVWIIMIDACPINAEGNLLDAAGISAIAALQDARFPEYDGTVIDYKTKSKKALPIIKVPIPVTVYKIEGKFLVDPLEVEEEAADARLTVTVIEDGNVVSLQKGGERPLTVDDIDNMINIAQEKSKELRKALK
jgi:exosome complex component RRP42